MSKFLGIDTSNYTTSVSVYDKITKTVSYAKQKLSVKSGECGLRQSEAVFQHVQKIPDVVSMVSKSLNDKICGIGVSSKPCDEKSSYMPCFTVGVSTAKCISSIKNIPCYEFSHQANHIAAALYGADKLELLRKKFIAFHVSGGTTQALLVQEDSRTVIKTQKISRSLDLKAGQLIDRVGVELGLNFPAGPEMEFLAKKSCKEFKITPVLKGFDCCLSGVQNICSKMIKDGCDKSDVAMFCIKFIEKTLLLMYEKILKEFGNLPVLFSGGVMSNSIIRESLTEKIGGIFSDPEFSSDNSVGVSILASEVKCEGN